MNTISINKDKNLSKLEEQLSNNEINIKGQIIKISDKSNYKANLEVICRSAHLLANALKMTGI
ncbi:hypothetical protein H3S89_04000 [Bartonella sp. B10834G6]|uniref:Uncharacterized protein n=1 Tax=Bartonella apis TaxID=1686310 RepID=A0A1R0F8Z4_9HYPH|nr:MULTISPECIES: hypothetical protein [Bartonella]MBH9981958.1 hypothetical protein [Bartonella apis]MBH9988093.1 hypothetical protein [Bartonella apis]MBI0169719.1 hypothetical protein [Bartonella sp. W8167]MBI0171830.1 hypothetical protein [Bartonella sp. W8151]MBI0174293.1 hypothetical protein [Bartonella apis]